MANLDQSPIMRSAASGDADLLRDELRGRAISSLYYFTKVVLGYKELADHFHLPLCNAIQNTIGLRKRGFLYPRGHFKSTIMKSYALWRLCGGAAKPGEDPRNLRVLVVGESDTVAKKNLNDTKWNVENNQILQWLFPEIIPRNTNDTKWTDTEILLPRTKTFDESTITTIGVGAKTTGFHYDVIIYDDMIGEKASKSEAEMQAAIEWFQYAPGLLNDQRFGEELIIGTRWKAGKADLYGWIMEELPENAVGDRGGFKWFIRGAYNDDGSVAFPERFSHEILEGIRAREKDYKFSCQYMNRPTMPEGADFNESQIKSFKVTEDGEGKFTVITPSDGSPQVRLRDLLRMSFYDPSSGGKRANCENAIVVVGTDALRRRFVLSAWSKNCGFGAAIERWHEMNDNYVCYHNYFEAVGAHKTVEELFSERRRFETVNGGACSHCQKHHDRISPIPVIPPGGSGRDNKEERIRTFAQAFFENGQVYIREGLLELRRQILSFPHGDLVDQFDCLAYLLWKSRAPASFEDIQTARADEQIVKDMRVQRTNCEHTLGGYI